MGTFNIYLDSDCNINFSGSKFNGFSISYIHAYISNASPTINFKGIASNWLGDTAKTSCPAYINFLGSSDFNGKVILPDVLNGTGGIASAKSINYWAAFRGVSGNFTVSDIYKASDCKEMFSGCTDFNSPVNIVNPYVNCSCNNMFIYCVNMNSPITIGEGVTECRWMFMGCENFNAPVTMANSIKNYYEMFNGCSQFNKPVSIGSDATSCFGMFANCYSLNSVVTIGNNVNVCTNMFRNCYEFNQPIDIPDSVTLCQNMFRYCNKFNSSIKLPNDPINVSGMFYGMNNFCKPLFIPDGWRYYGTITSSFDRYTSVMSFPLIALYPIPNPFNLHDDVMLHRIFDVIPDSILNNFIGATVISRDDAYVDTIVQWRFINFHPNAPNGGIEATRTDTREYVEVLIRGTVEAHNQNVPEFYNYYIGYEYVEDFEPYLENEPPYYNNSTYNNNTNLSGVTNGSFYFANCYEYNQSTTIPNCMSKADCMFARCNSFNQPVYFEE